MQAAAKDCDRLAVWKSQSENFPRLAIVGKYILGIPASSATSGRFFSAVGRTVTSDRCSLSLCQRRRLKTSARFVSILPN